METNAILHQHWRALNVNRLGEASRHDPYADRTKNLLRDSPRSFILAVVL